MSWEEVYRLEVETLLDPSLAWKMNVLTLPYSEVSAKISGINTAFHKAC